MYPHIPLLQGKDPELEINPPCISHSYHLN
jgi:hypothetical protein